MCQQNYLESMEKIRTDAHRQEVCFRVCGFYALTIEIWINYVTKRFP